MHRVETAQRLCCITLYLYAALIRPPYPLPSDMNICITSKFIYASRVRISINVQLIPALYEMSRDACNSDVSRALRQL